MVLTASLLDGIRGWSSRWQRVRTSRAQSGPGMSGLRDDRMKWAKPGARVLLGGKDSTSRAQKGRRQRDIKGTSEPEVQTSERERAGNGPCECGVSGELRSEQ